jgi:signal transduction histidine kinase/ABC-type uncharacterized transport system substrate-binding protein
VLVLHSYHEGLRWTDNVNEGLRTAFDNYEDQEVELFVEYLDAKRHTDSIYYKSLGVFYQTKLKHLNFDVVIVSDNLALQFVVDNRTNIFEGVPIVFCGVNNYMPSMLKGDRQITGITETVDIKGTIELIRKLNPALKELVVVNDDKTVTAIENKKIVRDLALEFSFHFKYFENLTISELRESVAEIGGQSAILLLTFSKDKEGQFLSFDNGVKLVTEAASVPVYGTWNFYLGKGILGGKILSGAQQGAKAAGLAMRILNGEMVENIPVVTQVDSQYAFDYRVMKRFNIRRDQIPANSLIVNSVSEFYNVNRKWIISSAVFVIFLFSVIVVLSNAIIQKRKAVESYKHEQQKLKLTIKEQRLIAQIVTTLNSDNNLSNTIARILKVISSYFYASKVSVFEIADDDSVEKIVGSYVEGVTKINELQQSEFSDIEELVHEVRNKKSIICNHPNELSPKYTEHFLKRNIGAAIILPILVHKDVLGMASITKDNAYQWTEREINLFDTITHLIANAWERSKQMRMLVQAREQHADALHMLEKSSRMASVGVIASGITHEIRQPLNAIKVTTDGIRFWQKRNPDQVPDVLGNKMELIGEGADRIESIIQQMRNYWIKPGQVEQSEVDLNMAINNGLDLIERQIQNHGITLKKELAHGSIPILGNEIQLEQVIINLVVNAVNALDKEDKTGKEIFVTSYKSMDHGILKIQDNGIGINEKDGDNIFDPFYSTQQKKEGTGLGLAIVKTFVDQMKGNITFENNAAGGVTFTISFSLA